MKKFLMVLLAFIMPVQAAANDYVNRGGVVYQRYITYKTYYYCGRAYQYPTYTYKEVLNYSKPDWRQQALTLIDKQKEREAFNQTLSYLGAQNLFAPAQPFFAAGHQQQYVPPSAAVPYPSVTGSTVGGYTSFEFSRYGTTTPMDLNRANEIIGGTIDQFNRTSADNSRRGTEIHGSVAALIDKNGERIGAIAELQETRATVKELSQGMAAMTQSFAQAMREMKPQPSESVKFERGGVGRVEGSQEGYAPPAYGQQPPPQAPPPQQGPRQPPPPDTDAWGIVQQYCGACHGRDLQEPQGGLYLDEKTVLDERLFGALALRVNPDAPDKIQGTNRPYRMPPHDYGTQPNIEERRAIVDLANALMGQQP